MKGSLPHGKGIGESGRIKLPREIANRQDSESRRFVRPEATLPVDTYATIPRNGSIGMIETTRGGWLVQWGFRSGSAKARSLQEAALAGLPILYPGLGAPYDGWETRNQAGSPSIPFP